MSSTPDELAAATRELALAALHEITPASTVGPYADHRVEAEGVVSLRFQNRLPGYPGWFWTVTVAQVDDTEPTVLEAELMPGDGALLAPDWVPWAERLAEYRAHQAELAEAAAEAEGQKTPPTKTMPRAQATRKNLTTTTRRQMTTPKTTTRMTTRMLR